MATRKQLSVGFLSIALVGVYSWIMMATSGSAASWAWLLLIAAAGLLVVAAKAERSA